MRDWPLWCAMVSAGALLSSQCLAQDEILDRTQLGAIADTVRHYKPKDLFDLPPAPPALSGKRFSYIVEPRQVGPQNEICEGFPHWGYWQKDTHYEVSAGNGDVRPHALRLINGPALKVDPKSKWDVFINFMSFSCDKRRLPSYTASNAFGGQVQIQHSHETVTAIGFLAGDIWDKPDYWKKTAVGDEARHLATNVKVRVSGALSHWPDGRTLLCGSETGITPSMSYPFDKEVDICLFAAKPERLEFFDASTGEILYVANSKYGAQ